MGQLLGVISTSLWRYEDDGTVTLVASWGKLHHRAPVGDRFPLLGESVASRVFRTARPARMDDYANATGAVGKTFKALGACALTAGGLRAGSGLQGIWDRLAAIDGRLEVESPADGGTPVAAVMPVPANVRRSAVSTSGP